MIEVLEFFFFATKKYERLHFKGGYQSLHLTKSDFYNKCYD